MEEHQQNPFLNSALVIGFVFALVISVISIAMSYSIINSEPSGSLFSPTIWSSVVVCFVGVFAGLFAVRHHVKQFNAPLQMGRGAVIGFTTGAIMSVAMSVFSLIWLVIDPSFNEKLMQALIANFEAITEIPAAQKEEIIDSIYNQFQKQGTVIGQLTAVGINILVFGALDALSGILGVKLFAPKADPLEI
jgi:uncharacterized protein YqgC (DUF456 family)